MSQKAAHSIHVHEPYSERRREQRSRDPPADARALYGQIQMHRTCSIASLKFPTHMTRCIDVKESIERFVFSPGLLLQSKHKMGKNVHLV